MSETVLNSGGGDTLELNEGEKTVQGIARMLKLFFDELAEIEDKAAKGHPTDDNFYVSGAISGPTYWKAMLAMKVLARVAEQDFDRLDKFLSRTEQVLDQIEGRLKAKPQPGAKTMKDYGLKEGSFIDQAMEIRIDPQTPHKRFPAMVNGYVVARDESQVKEFVKGLNAVIRD